MVFLGSLVAVAVALVLLGLLLAGLAGPGRRLAAARTDLVGTVPRVRTLRAAVVAMRQRGGPARVASAPDDREGISS